MIVEMRSYDLINGRLNAFLAFYEANGLPIQKRILGGLICFLVTEIGPLNQVVHLWRYADLQDRERRRQKLAEDPDWPVYLAKVPDYVDRMDTRILRNASFSPLAEG